MQSQNNYEAIFFDFDGVIVSSQEIRVSGFLEIFKEYPRDLVERLVEYHLQNGGISRYEKIKWFYTELLNKQITKSKLEEKAEKFKSIMLDRMKSKQIIINQTLDFIKKIYAKYPLHIISGSDENELKEICLALEISKYFKTIKGSPKVKTNLIKDCLLKEKYNPIKVIYIGDSIIDYKSSKENNLIFYGFNNMDLKEISDYYIDNFSELKI